jgi:hypothetical protein
MSEFMRPAGLPKIGNVLRVWHEKDEAETWEELQVVQICGEDDGSFLVYLQFFNKKVLFTFKNGEWSHEGYTLKRIEIAY